MAHVTQRMRRAGITRPKGEWDAIHACDTVTPPYAGGQGVICLPTPRPSATSPLEFRAVSAMLTAMTTYVYNHRRTRSPDPASRLLLTDRSAQGFERRSIKKNTVQQAAFTHGTTCGKKFQPPNNQLPRTHRNERTTFPVRNGT